MARSATARRSAARRGLSRRMTGSRTSTKTKGEQDMSITRHGPGPRMSAAVVHGNTVYLAGQVSGDSDTMKGQTEQVLKKIDGLLASAGTSKSKLLSATIYITDMRLFNDMNAVWDAWVDPQNTPARATVQAALANPKLMVEISIVAGI